jgi:hypothetical protein
VRASPAGRVNSPPIGAQISLMNISPISPPMNPKIEPKNRPLTKLIPIPRLMMLSMKGVCGLQFHNSTRIGKLIPPAIEWADKIFRLGLMYLKIESHSQESGRIAMVCIEAKSASCRHIPQTDHSNCGSLAS